MMKKRMCSALVVSALLLASIVGCSANKGEEASEITNESEESEEVKDIGKDTSEDSVVDDVINNADDTEGATSEEGKAIIYITLDGGESYVETPVILEEEMTPELLIQQLADITGWNLDLADQVTSGPGGMTVVFAKSSSLYVGPPEEQKEEYFIFDRMQMSSAVLDSVKHTLQYNFVDAELGGNPESLDIYYCGEGDLELFFEEIGGKVPITEPYSEIKYEQGDLSANLYYPDDELLEMQKVGYYEKITNEQELYDAWEKYAKLDTDTQVLGFDGKTLNLSNQFATLISNFGTSGESMYIEGLATTFKEYYSLDELYLTIEGEVLETGHNIYDYAL